MISGNCVGFFAGPARRELRDTSLGGCPSGALISSPEKLHVSNTTAMGDRGVHVIASVHRQVNISLDEMGRMSSISNQIMNELTVIEIYDVLAVRLSAVHLPNVGNKVQRQTHGHLELCRGEVHLCPVFCKRNDKKLNSAIEKSQVDDVKQCRSQKSHACCCYCCQQSRSEEQLPTSIVSTKDPIRRVSRPRETASSNKEKSDWLPSTSTRDPRGMTTSSAYTSKRKHGSI